MKYSFDKYNLAFIYCVIWNQETHVFTVLQKSVDIVHDLLKSLNKIKISKLQNTNRFSGMQSKTYFIFTKFVLKWNNWTKDVINFNEQW